MMIKQGAPRESGVAVFNAEAGGFTPQPEVVQVNVTCPNCHAQAQKNMDGNTFCPSCGMIIEPATNERKPL
jgi:Zn finger protein HypA/HybF involved in hydrogenase expression